MRLVSIGLALALGLSTSARADWQWTKWGMSPEELVSASAGKARLATEEETKQKSPGPRGGPPRQAMLATATHTAGELQFHVFFLFAPATRRLECVRLRPLNLKLEDTLRDQLITVYGKPTDARRDTITSGFWIGHTVWVGEDKIELTTTSQGPSSAVLDYCSRKAGAAGGL